MNFKWNDLVPVVISVFVIILVAVVEKHSKLVAAVTATMPLTIPLALWIVHSSSQGDTLSIEQFTRSMVAGILATLAFSVAVWLAARAGLRLAWIIIVGYAVWGLALMIILALKRQLGL